MPTLPHDVNGLESFDSPTTGVVQFVCKEFTCVCPKTGQPDFAEIHIRYVPCDTCIESKSLKLYFWSFRGIGAFHESVTQRILDDLAGFLQPKWMQVLGIFNVRGGLYERVLCTKYPVINDTIAQKSYEENRFTL